MQSPSSENPPDSMVMGTAKRMMMETRRESAHCYRCAWPSALVLIRLRGSTRKTIIKQLAIAPTKVFDGNRDLVMGIVIC
jgi:hypothetical protein